MKINKNDLAKEFELVTKQEIINHNKQIESSNTSINELRNKIEDHKKEQSLINSLLGNGVTDSNARSLKLSDSVLNLSEKIVSNLNDINNRINRDFESLEQIKISIDLANRAFEKNNRKIDNISLLNKRNESIISDIEKIIPQEIERSENRMLKSLERLKDFINHQPSQTKQLKNDLWNEIQAHKVDCESVNQEISCLKETVFVLEKKIENLYTLIGRLTNKVNS